MSAQAPVSSLWQRHSVRGDIQGLRAVAVLMVLIFHIWPHALPGGYVGVDVFFVISGYLIVGSLVKELERTGKVSLIDFYRRRARRLMPAALLVLSVVLMGTIFWLPDARWEDSLLQIAASSLYVQNWYLSWASVDYLAAENSASPVLHYWSLSIEEQFYILWPLVMLAVAWVVSRTGAAARPVAGAVLLAVFFASFIASLLLTASSPPQAYFFSHTRFWEIALGGLMAIWLPTVRVGNWARVLLFCVGLGLVLLSGITYGDVGFPGWRALLPTVGAALIILAGGFRFGWFQGVDTAALRYVGDISYSLYLWHWPIIVFYTVWRDTIGLWDGLGIVLVTFVVSHFSYHYVEQYFRYRDTSVRLGPLAAGLFGAVLVAGCSFLVYGGVVSAVPAGQSAEAVAATDYPGPAALVSGAVVPSGVPLRPAPAHLLRDSSPVYDLGCHQSQRDSEVTTCVLGDRSASFRVAVVGSSHSVNWLPAMDVLGRKNGWQIVSITKSACGFRNSDSKSCNQWHVNLIEYLRQNPMDLVFIGESAGKESSVKTEQLIASRWQKIIDLGMPIVAVKPTPHLKRAPADCLPNRIEACVLPRGEAERANTITRAAEEFADVHVIDMNDTICGETCGPVVGNIVVYRDTHHLTATYSRALAPYLEERMASVAHFIPIKDEKLDLNDLVFSPHGSGIGARLQCGPFGSAPSTFSREYPLTIDEGGRLLLRRGSWRDENQEFEAWDGSVERDVVRIEGRYREGGGGVKLVTFVGTMRDGELVAAGTRGPRTCSLHWVARH